MAAGNSRAESNDFRRLVAQQGMDPLYYGPERAKAFWLAEIDRWEKVIKSAGLDPK